MRMSSPLPLLMGALALAACGSGGSGSGSGAAAGGGAVAITVPFQTALPTQAFGPLGASAPLSVSSTFTAGQGITASGGVGANLNTTTVTITTTAGGDLVSLELSATPGGGPGIPDTIFATAANSTKPVVGITTVPITAAQLAPLVAAIAAAPVNSVSTVYQGTAASLSYTGYGSWMMSAGGGSYNVGFYSFGQPTPVMPVIGTASYTGTTIGFGSSGATPFSLTGTVTAMANFAADTIPSFQLSNFVTHDVNDANPGPVLPTLSGSGTITGNQYFFTLSGGAFNGSVGGQFFGPGARETGGVWGAVNGTTTVTGGFGAHQ
jgi:hypothetical protein